MRRLLRLRSARAYVLASTIDALGDFALWLATGIWVKSLTGSSAAAGLVFFFFTAGSLTSPLSGIVVDRVRRKPLMIVVNLLTATLLATLLLANGREELWLIYLVMFLYGVSGSISSSAATALLPRIVGDELLGEANGVLQTAREGLRLVTPIIGAGVYAWVGPHVVVLIDMGTFVIATALLLTVKVDEPRPQPDADAAPATWWHESTEGARFIMRTAVLRQMILTCSVALLAIGFFETIAFSVVTVGLRHSATFMGPIEVAQGVGAIGGGLVSARLLRRFGGGYMVAAALTVLGLSCPAFAGSNEPLVFASIIVIGASLPWLMVGFTTTLQRCTPSRLMGRVGGATDLLLTGPQTFSIALGAALVSIVPYQDLLYCMGVVLVGCGVYLSTRPEQRLGAARQSTAAEIPDTDVSAHATPPEPAGASADASPVPEPGIVTTPRIGADPAAAGLADD
jgi:MFS family permease